MLIPAAKSAWIPGNNAVINEFNVVVNLDGSILKTPPALYFKLNILANITFAVNAVEFKFFKAKLAPI